MQPDAKILAFDTSTAHCAVALLSGDDILADMRMEMDKGQAEHLLPLCEDALKRGGFGWTDLNAIAVCTGPGNFTGIRISVSTARGLSLALGIPAIGVTLFEAMAFGNQGRQTLALPARRGHIYSQDFDGEDALSDAAMTKSDEAVERPYLMPCGYTLPVTLAHVGQRKDTSDKIPPAPYYIQAPDAAIPKSITPKMLS
ncbi:MAG: tRNA (adenosine(37)-N6)-threonylcarbamoyltransferase complex dimerization subunit type 1 TsaB [Pseudomonadota bacterium]